MRRHGTTAAGAQRYRCGCCSYTYTDSANEHGGHRHGVQGRTAADRARASRNRTGKTGNEARAKLSRVVGESNAAFEPLLAKLSLPVKMELYKAIYSDAANMPEEVLTLGVALTSDPAVQGWLSMAFRK